MTSEEKDLRNKRNSISLSRRKLILDFLSEQPEDVGPEEEILSEQPEDVDPEPEVPSKKPEDVDPHQEIVVGNYHFEVCIVILNLTAHHVKDFIT